MYRGTPHIEDELRYKDADIYCISINTWPGEQRYMYFDKKFPNTLCAIIPSNTKLYHEYANWLDMYSSSYDEFHWVLAGIPSQRVKKCVGDKFSGGKPYFLIQTRYIWEGNDAEQEMAKEQRNFEDIVAASLIRAHSYDYALAILSAVGIDKAHVYLDNVHLKDSLPYLKVNIIQMYTTSVRLFLMWGADDNGLFGNFLVEKSKIARIENYFNTMCSRKEGEEKWIFVSTLYPGERVIMKDNTKTGIYVYYEIKTM